jgi:hypothetical protein
MEKFRSSLQKAMSIKPTIFNYEQKLEISIQIAIGLISLHTGNFKLNHNDM